MNKLIGTAAVLAIVISLLSCTKNHEQSDRSPQIATYHGVTGNRDAVDTIVNKAKRFYDIDINYDSCRRYAEIALNLSADLNYKLGKAKAYSCIAASFASQGDILKAQENFIYSLDEYKDMGDSLSVGIVECNIGAILLSKPEYKVDAYDWLVKSCKIADSIGNEALQIQYHLMMAPFDEETEHYEEAKREYIGAISIMKEKYKDSMDFYAHDFAVAYKDYALNFFRQGNLDSSMTLDYTALNYELKVSNKSAVLANILNGLGAGYEEKGSFNKALEYYYRSLAINRALNSEEQTCRSFSNLALLYADMHEFSQAKTYADSALVYADAFHVMDLQISSYEVLSVVSEADSDFRSAFKYERVVNKLSNTLNKIKSRVGLENAKLNRKVEQALEEKDKREARKAAIAATIYGSSAVFMTILMTFVIRNKKKWQEKKWARIVAALFLPLALVSTIVCLHMFSHYVVSKIAGESVFFTVLIFSVLSEPIRWVEERAKKAIDSLKKDHNDEGLIQKIRKFMIKMLTVNNKDV